MEDPAAGVRLTFTAAAAPSRSQFGLFDAGGEPVTSTARTGDGGLTWRVQPTRPLPSGDYELDWKVTAADAHPLTGTVSFRVRGSTPAPATAAGATPAGSTVEESTTSQPAHRVGPDRDPLAGVLAGLGRWLSFTGALVAVGALVLLVSTLVGSTGEIQLAGRLIRSGGLVAAGGVIAEGAGLAMTLDGAVPGQTSAALALRLGGGLGILALAGTRARPVGGRGRPGLPVVHRIARARVRQRDDELAGTAVLTSMPRSARARGGLERPVPVALAAAAMLVSFLLDGHTTTTEPRALVLAANLAHTGAAAVWVGGVALVGVLLMARSRAGSTTGALELAVRFSVPAAGAVLVAGLAGAALALTILGAPADLLSTAWGRVLLAKLVLVGVVAVLGYVNNRYALPALDGDHAARRVLRRTVTAEAVAMLAVLAVTAILVASAA